MNIFGFEIRSLRNMLFWWLIGIILIVTIYLSVYPAFSKDVETITHIYSNLPEALKQTLNIEALSADKFNFLGFLANIMSFLLLAGSIQAAVMGVGLLSKERRSKTTDFLFSKPVTRTKLFSAKYAAGLVAIIGTWLVFAGSIYAMSQFVGAGEFSLKSFLLFMGVFGYIQLWFFNIGILLSQVTRKIRSNISLGLALSFSLFVLGLFGATVGDDKIRYLSPFRHIDFMHIINHATYEWRYVIFGVITVLVSLVISFIIYTRRDAPSVA